VFGPNRQAALVEGSKAHAKKLMEAAGIPTAAYRTFTDAASALDYVQTCTIPVVVKADGLAAGKGVVVALNRADAEDAVHTIMEEKIFGESGNQVVIEEFLTGQEASVMAFVDGTVVKIMQPAQDHKPLHNGDEGPNTGGMGAYSPVPAVSAALLLQIEQTILRPMAQALVDVGTPFSGVLYAGMMLTEVGPKVIEFNARLGDPESQVILPRMQNDLVDVCLAVCQHTLEDVTLQWTDEAAVCVVVATPGYPAAPQTGAVIDGLKTNTQTPARLAERSGSFIYHAGTALAADSKGYITAGGRVLGVTALGSTLQEAVGRAYEQVKQLSFPGMHYRTDIAAKAFEQ
ncbi:MAG: phosphoribosylamine/glycine ligase, partial [Bacilli bacterium]|nr:phosphoribosylamine/glycine ligase [Bacilli bacterium]